MTSITLQMSEELAAQLGKLVELCNDARREPGGVPSPGALTVPRLLAMLAADAAKIVSRPESRAGSGMADVLAAHGYRI